MVNLLSTSYTIQRCSFRRCGLFIVLFHVGGTIYKRQHRGKYLYHRTVFRHVRNFGGSSIAMGYVALPGKVEIKESGDVRLCMVRPNVCMCMRNLSERWKIFAT